MTDIQMRGYVLLSAAEYLRASAGEKRANDLLAGASPALRGALSTASSASWCKAEHHAEMFHLIASLAGGDDEKAKDLLIACGKAAAHEASNTFLRLLMKVLTPTLFAKKLPDIWARDCTGATVTVEVHEEKIRNRLSGVGGFDHIAPVAVGYVLFALEAMGKKITRVDLHEWSLATPGPDKPWFEIHWAA
ncbi:MAG TPA: hypothetical protein VHE30_29765 [Polyangiaceae bacterium]|nr:hypothetical protein [Polyangiaceae bacterium]